jgi:hypothetical protein
MTKPKGWQTEMAFFQAMGRLTFTMTVSIPGTERVVTVCDDGWKIWFKDPENNNAHLYSISLGTDSTRKPDRETALQIIGEQCGWWSNRHEMFTHPELPHFHESFGETPIEGVNTPCDGSCRY